MQALLDLVETDRAERCAAIEAESSQAARQLLREARRAARARLTEAVDVERRRLRESLAALEAMLATETRLAAQRRLRERLDEMWRQLPSALVSRWNDSASRREWVASVLEPARELLGRADCRIAHAPGWPEEERQEVTSAFAACGIAGIGFEECPGERAGLAVRADGNVVDGTLAGLLADRAAIGARLTEALAAEGAG
jgi:hypothetical protein